VGRLAYRLGAANLDRHLPEPPVATPCRALDVAGGNGVEAVALAERGWHVTLVDSSPVMLAGARDRATSAGVADRVVLIEADVRDLPALVRPAVYDQ
jgi:S-adenosylmethionine-dependent methyltransferase